MTTIVIMNIGTVKYDYSRHGQLGVIFTLYPGAKESQINHD